MRKVIMKKKRVRFTLEQEQYSIHTFELSRKLTKFEYKQLKEYLYQYNKNGQSQRTYSKHDGQVHICPAFNQHGVRIRLENITNDDIGHCYLRMIINPRRLIDPESSYVGILEPTRDSIQAVGDAFEELFQGTPIENDLNQYYLSRVDQCVNLSCDKNKIYRELIRVMRKASAPSKLERKQYNDKDKKKANRYNKHYIRFACKAYEVVIYDKTF